MSRRVRHVVVAWCQWTTILLLLLATITTMTLPNKLTPICHAFRTTEIVGRSSHYYYYFRHYNYHDGWYTNGGPSLAGMSHVIRQQQQQQRVSNPDVSHGRIHFRRSLTTKTTTTTTTITTSLASTNTAFSSLSLTSSSILVRSLFLRALAFVYAISFLVALRQNKALMGDFGITPAKRILDEAQVRGEFKRQRRWQWRKDGMDRITRSGMKMHPWWRKLYHLAPIHYIRPWHWMSCLIDANPILIRIREIWWDRSDSSDRPVTTLLWLADESRTNLNTWLDSIAWSGLTLSVAMAVMGAANVPCILSVWMLHRSLMAVGGPWYAFGWEPQLAELGFHSLFLVPLWSLDPWHPLPIPALVRWCIKWHLFRVMMGSGLIKLRSSDVKWKTLTAMNYFYETQPIPNPLSRYFHWMPSKWHKIEVCLNHFVELVAPWLLIIPGLPVSLRRTGGILQIIFQSVLITCGNLSFLNWLTMIPAIMCFDDAMLLRFLSPTKQAALRAASASSWMYISISREVLNVALLLLVLALSRNVVINLCSSNQVMNRSYDPLRLINTYGAFGTVNEHRDEYIISSACTWDGEWREYEFKAKPGNVHRAPRFLSPYHYRLDWQMWIAASFGRIENSPWMYPFLEKLLQQDPAVLQGLMDGDPWIDSVDAPRYIRVQLYRYHFHKAGTTEDNPPYWDREFIRNVFPQHGLATVSSLQSMSPLS